jgi:exodeoxyribonuclease V gamma subunit
MRDCLSARFDIKEFEFRDGSAGLSFETLHHLNAIHPDYFNGSEKLFSYSQSNLLATRNLVTGSPAKDDREKDLPAAPDDEFEAEGVIELDELKKFFVNPAKYYYEKVMGVYFDFMESGLPADDEPMASGGLEAYKIKQDIMERIETELDMDIGFLNQDSLIPVYEVEGAIPLGEAGVNAVDEITANIGDWLSKEIKVNDISCGILGNILRKRKDAVTASHRLTVTTSDGTEKCIAGESEFIQLQTDEYFLNLQVDARPSGLRSKDKINSWLSHLFVCAVLDDSAVHTFACGYKKVSGSKVALESVCFEPVAADDAKKHLSDLLDLYQKGQTEVLPFAPETSEEYCKVLVKTLDPDGALKKADSKWGMRKNDEYGRSEVHDNFMFHAFGEDGPMIKDGQDNGAFYDIAKTVFDPMFNADAGDKKGGKT